MHHSRGLVLILSIANLLTPCEKSPYFHQIKLYDHSDKLELMLFFFPGSFSLALPALRPAQYVYRIQVSLCTRDSIDFGLLRWLPQPHLEPDHIQGEGRLFLV